MANKISKFTYILKTLQISQVILTIIPSIKLFKNIRFY